MNNGNGSKTQPGLLDPLTNDELVKLELALDAVGSQWGIAARLMSRLGLRVGEVARLCWRHVDMYPPGEPMINLTADITKTGYARTLPIPHSLTELLIDHRHLANAAWAERFDPDAIDGREHPFLATPVIAKRNHDRVSPRWFQLIITKTAQRTLGRRVRPHTLRHTFATRLLRKTNMRVVQAALGHRSIRSTQIYTHPTMGDLRAAIQQAEENDK
jgi:integrase